MTERSIDAIELMIILIAQRAKWPLSDVEPFIDLMHTIDKQTLERHGEGRQ